LGLSWWLYAILSPHAAQITQELQVVSTGEDHPSRFYAYFPWIARAVAPWTAFMILGLIAAIAHFRHDQAPRVLLAWITSIFIPLLLVGNKQQHYLLPLMPPLMILVGRMLDAILRHDRDLAPPRAVAPLLYATLIVFAAGAVAIIFRSKPINTFDAALGAAL